METIFFEMYCIDHNHGEFHSDNLFLRLDLDWQSGVINCISSITSLALCAFVDVNNTTTMLGSIVSVSIYVQSIYNHCSTTPPHPSLRTVDYHKP